MQHHFIKSATLLLILITFTTTFAQNDFRRWQPEDGVAVRQGWHLEWFRTMVSRTEGELTGEVGFVWSDCRNGCRDIYMQVIDTDGEFKFDENGLRVTSNSLRQEDPIIYPSRDGGWFIGWVDFRADTLGDVYCTKINSDGEQPWGENGLGIPITELPWDYPRDITFVEDNEGGCIIAWRDRRRGEEDIYAMHITGEGESDENWEENGVSVVSEAGPQYQLDVISDGEGGMIISWKDHRIDHDPNIWAQRITPEGELLWGDGEGVIICNNEEEQEKPKICSDGTNGAFITWVDERNHRETNRDIYAQHINSEGQLLWGEEGAAVCVEEFEQRSVQITASGETAAIICWEDARDERDYRDIYAMKISGDDEMVNEWETESGIPVVIAQNNQNEVRLCPDGEGGAYFVWQDERGGGGFPEVDVWAQRFNSDGENVWQENGIPVCTADRQQGYPVVYLTENSCTIAWIGSEGLQTQRVTGNGEFVWEEIGRTIINGFGGNAHYPKLLRRGNGEFVAIWQDGRWGGSGMYPFIQYCRNNGDQVEMLLQKDGQQVFGNTNGGGAFPDAVMSDDGNVFVVWQDHRINQAYSVYAQKLSEAGDLMWGESGTRISDEDNQFDITNPKVCSDDNGGIYVAWESDTEERYVNLYMQHIDSEGNRLWEEDMQVTNHEMDDKIKGIIPDGFGGAVLVWEADSYEVEYDIWAARINSNGEHTWGDDNNGLVICNAQLRQRDPQLIRHQNGYVIVWTDGRDDSFEEPQNDIFGQFINYNGSFRWHENGAAICTNEYHQEYPSVAIDNETNIWVTWEDHRPVNRDSRRDIYFQKFSSQATEDPRPIKLLDDENYGREGIPLCTAENDQLNPSIVHDGHNGMWIVWEDQRGISYYSEDIYATHLNSEGVPFDGWGDSGQVVCDAHHRQESPEAVLLRSAGETGIVTAWIDKRSTAMEDKFNIYTQRLDDDYVSVRRQTVRNNPAVFTLDEPYPNPFNSQTMIKYTAKSDGYVKIGLYDITGRLVRQLVNKKIVAGSHQLTLNAETLAAGQYIVRLEAGDTKLERKIVLLK